MKETGYLLQCFLILAWWIGLSVSEPFFAAFQFPGIPAVAFKAKQIKTCVEVTFEPDRED